MERPATDPWAGVSAESNLILSVCVSDSTLTGSGETTPTPRHLYAASALRGSASLVRTALTGVVSACLRWPASHESWVAGPARRLGLAIVMIGLLAAAPASATAAGGVIQSAGMQDDGSPIGPVGPLYGCPGGGTACLGAGEPVAVEVTNVGRWSPPGPPLLLHAIALVGVAQGSTRAAVLRPLADGGFTVAALSGVMAIEPGRLTLTPGIPIEQGAVVALTDGRALGFSKESSLNSNGLSEIGPVGSRVDRVALAGSGMLVHRTQVETDADGDGVVDSLDLCHGPNTGAVCPVTAALAVAGRPDAVTAGQAAWLDVTLPVSGPPRGTQAMGALVDVAVTPADAAVKLPGECAETSRDPSIIRIRCRASYVTSGPGPRFPLQVTPQRPGGEVAATATLQRLWLRDVDRDVPLTSMVAPAVAKVRVRGYDAFRATATLLRSRTHRSLRLAITCPGGWILTTCPLAVRVTAAGGREATRARTLRLRPSARRTLTLPLRAEARRRLARTGRLKVRVVVTRGEVDGRVIRDVVTGTVLRG